MIVPSEVKDLVKKFSANLDVYNSPTYNEHNICKYFINRLFSNLGWNVTDETGDVIYEKTIKISDTTGRPDYSFGIGKNRKFFLEAKKPYYTIHDNKDFALQLRRYGWSQSHDFSLLCNFKELSIYHCKYQPKITQDAGYARLDYIKFEDYISKWDYLYDRFSYDAIKSGEYIKALNLAKVKGMDRIDEVLLKDIENWRKLLATNIANRNLDLTQSQINFAVQQTIDRIIFLRICEDRGIENYEQLKHLQKGADVYSRLFQIFKNADDKYNSGLFHFSEESKHDFQVDKLSEKLIIDDSILKTIFKSLYPPVCPYVFDVMPADILGQVYEKFLGKVIQLSAGHHVKIVDKPELKKGKGVFYTPTFIVKYIIDNTLGCKRKLTDVKILDPACGSGNFLLEAYQYLLDWY